MSYDPRPIDTRGALLPPELELLLEKLAKNVHDHWALVRIREGWTYGPKRDDLKLKHPCLVPYEMLPESEKAYDRTTAGESLRAILASGFEIVRQQDAVGDGIGSSTGDQPEALEYIARLRSLTFRELVEEWRERHRRTQLWWGSFRIYETCSRLFIGYGEPFYGFDVASEAAARWQNTEEGVIFEILKGLALARSGSVFEAASHLGALIPRICHDPRLLEEVKGMLARTWKDFGLQASSATERERCLSRSLELYQETYQATGGSWPAINAATLALFLGREDEAAHLSSEVSRLCLEEADASHGTGRGSRLEEDYWLLATLGEAALVRQEFGEAAECYARAGELASRHYGHLTSTRRNARLILRALDRDPAWIDAYLVVPPVVLFLAPDLMPGERVSVEDPLMMAVRERIAEELTRSGAGFGFSSASAGYDLHFLQVMQEMGRETRVVLPYESGPFIEDRVTPHVLPDERPSWGEMFESAWNRASDRQTIFSQRLRWGSGAHRYARDILWGLAELKARDHEVPLTLLAIDPGVRPANGGEDTVDRIRELRGRGFHVDVIDLSKIRETLGVSRSDRPASQASSVTDCGPPEEKEKALHTRVMAILFADVVNYTGLTEDLVPVFLQNFMSAVAKVAEPYAPETSQTWGDALHFVLDDVRNAGQLALDIRDMMSFENSAPDWHTPELPRDLKLRIGLHVGPVYLFENPVSNEQHYTGFHVSRAARLEPVTPANEVFASREFAAYCARHGVTEFSCEYAGVIAMPKAFGDLPTYFVLRPPVGLGKAGD